MTDPSRLDACFEGVIPSVIATTGPDGEPNISYLSHVTRVDDDHIALSNQFFGKTAANLRGNPCATILMVDGRTGAQFRVEALFVRSETQGPLFAHMDAQLTASSAQLGMSNTMKLKGIDIFRILSISAPPTQAPVAPADTAPVPSLPALAAAVTAIDTASEISTACEALLDASLAVLDADAAMILMCDHPRDALIAVLSRGYDAGGAGAEVPFGVGVIGLAASTRQVIRIGDIGRVRRLNAAIDAQTEPEARSRRIPLPGLGGALSHMAVPLITGQNLVGVMFVESRSRLAFGIQHEAAAAILARALATAMRGDDLPVPAAVPGPTRSRPPLTDRVIRVRHYTYDDSVFIDDAYVIKGVAGRILVFLIETCLEQSRDAFTNREIRLASSLRLPGYRDNLETRLILLRRRLEERAAPIRLEPIGRGRIRLVLEGRPELITAGPGEDTI
ncbi:GAF domain-containing protein [Paracoccus limosus]|uniref:GAF domain-containing protein n=1 Tax=Paracoccus limosus TaxID=913252 RepID=A0A844H9X2_9RHOB|nr:GAF domain-containing protein [Paracoccus limosus]MTH36480.1 GAF domain-containing protein [Paracoccus limosus]